MDVVLSSCAGLDIHKKSIMACVNKLGEEGKVDKRVKRFGTMTGDLLHLSDWMAAQDVTHVAMESTGVFWKPVFNIIEDRFETLLVNARHIKQVPGRKTDVKDCEWIAQLLQHGLLRASFVPPRPHRELRELTRHRAQLSGEKSRAVNRIHKTLEDANVKLGSVASDIMGKSGRAMIEALIAGEQDAAKLAELALRKLRGKIPELRLALEGSVHEHHRFMLKTLYGHVQYLERLIVEMDARIEEVMSSQELKAGCSTTKEDATEENNEPLPFDDAVRLLETIPGISTRTAQNLLAEIGTDMSQFPSAAHLASWAAMCPGNRESAGKRGSGKTAKGNRWLRRALCQSAWSASRSKDTYLNAQYRRLAPRRGKKRAIVAVGHTLLVVVYHMLKSGTAYADLGPQHFDQIDPERLARYLVKRLNSLGYDVLLEKDADAA